MKPLVSRVLLATDFSRCADLALGYALAIASWWKAELHVFHVLEFLPGMDPQYPVNKMYLDELRKEATQHLNAIEKRAASAGISIRRTIEIGIPSQRIEAAAGDLNMDLIVMGMHGRTGLEHVLVGSTAERVVRTAPCPVLSVKGGRDERPHATAQAGSPGIRRLVIPIDFSASSLDALEYGVQFAKHLGASVTILHVLEPVAYGLDFTLGRSAERREQKEHVQSKLKVLCALCTSNGVNADSVLKAGLPADSIREYVDREKPDLVIMGTHGRRGISRLLSGSVAEGMLRLACCPVLAVRMPCFDPGHRRIMPGGDNNPAV
ncbi:MAG TPA: universal stress protein [Nitrospiraceae bacterium]|nr:universal stress protein [Nitrospiraceae bacterium]